MKHTDVDKKAYWQDTLQTCTNSGKPISIWCRENNIPVSTCFYWKKRLTADLPEVSFEEIFLPQAEPSPAGGEFKAPAEKKAAGKPFIRIEYSGFTVTLSGIPDPGILSSVLCTMRQSC